jgi:uncharacterized protein YcbX
MMSNRPSSDTGSVVSLWRYPVKSMMGEELHATYVTDGGFLGDRVYAVIDQSTGKIASAKHPRKWGKLFDFRAVFMEPLHPGEQLPSVRITDPMPRCVMTTLPQGDLPRDLGILRTVAQHSQVSIPALGGEARPSVGVCAFVLQGGTIRRGDPVRIA